MNTALIAYQPFGHRVPVQNEVETARINRMLEATSLREVVVTKAIEIVLVHGI